MSYNFLKHKVCDKNDDNCNHCLMYCCGHHYSNTAGLKFEILNAEIIEFFFFLCSFCFVAYVEYCVPKKNLDLL